MKPAADKKSDELQNPRSNAASLSPPPPTGAEAASISPDRGKPPRAPSSNDKPEHIHQRNISWGLNEIKTLRIPGPALRQRSDISILSQPQTINNPDGSQFSLNLPYQGDRFTRRFVMDIPNNLGLINPMEVEAETYLLRAIERAGAEADAQANILNNIPNKALEALDRKLLDDRESSSAQGQCEPSVTGLPPGTSRSTKTVRKPDSTPKTGQHRRNMTLDETLLGLSHAMDAIHAESEQPVARPMPVSSRSRTYGGRRRSGTIDSIGGRTPTVVESHEEDDEKLSPSSAKDGRSPDAEQSFEHAIPNTAALSGLTHRPVGKTSAAKNDKIADIEEGKPKSKPNSDDDSKGEKDDNISSDQSTEGGSIRSNTERRSSRWARASALLFSEWGVTGDMRNFIRPKRKIIRIFFVIMVVYIAIPCLATAAILFYLCDNPPTGVLRNYGKAIEGKLINTNGDEVDPRSISISFLLIFGGVRQMVTLGMALLTQLFLIDFLAIDRGLLFKLGSRLPLFIMQAKGWPFVLFFWSVYDWTLLAGTKPFFSHWLHFQKWIALFNESNPDGNLIPSDWNHRILSLATGISFAVAVKRFWIAIFLGRQTYYQYSEKLASLMSKMLLISEVAGLSLQAVSTQGREFLRKREMTIAQSLTLDEMDGLMDNAYDDASAMGSKSLDDSLGVTATTGGTGLDGMKPTVVIDPEDCNPYTGRLSSVQRNRITRLLGAWEEPNEDIKNTEAMSIASLMHFRRALTHLRTELPFSSSFGPAGTREDCVASSQEVFERLMKMSDLDEALNFEVIALLGAKSDGTLDQNKLLDLIKLFRPDRDGSLSMVHFVRSVDQVYKEVRMLRASVHNSSKVDGQFETIFNFLFYTVNLVIALNVLGFDPFALFLSVSGLILGFAFMIGTASSKYFEGLLFILVRRPYGIGDCIHISDPNIDTSYSGSAFWYVEDITLFSTQVRFAFTNERASLSNGSLANSRIINSSKSNNAGVYHMLKFPLDVPYEKVKMFHEALEAFVRNRPREWIGLSSFRATSVNAQLGFIEYIVCLDHRESWASWSQVRTSQSDLMGFGVELAKKLDIVYKQPTLPIDLSMKQQTEDIADQITTGNSPLLSSIVDPSENMQGAGEGDSFRRPSISREFQRLAAQFPPRTPLSKTD